LAATPRDYNPARPTQRRLSVFVCVLFLTALAQTSALYAQAAAPDPAVAVSPETREAELRAAIARLPATSTDSLAEAHNSLGLLYWTESQFDSAQVHLRHAQALWAELGDTAGLGRSFNNIGVTYYQAGHFEPALAAFSRSLALRRQLGNSHGAALVLTNMGRTYVDLQLYDRAQAALEEGLAAAEASGHPGGIGYTLHQLGMLHLATGNLPEARRYLNASMDVYRGDDVMPTDAASGWALNSVALGLLYVKEGDHAGGIATLEEALTAAEKDGHRRRQVAALLNLGRAWRASGDLDRAVHYLESSLDVATEGDQRMFALDALAELADAHEASGDTRAALARLRAHSALRDAMFNQNTLQRIAGMESREATQQQEIENARLRAEQQVRDAVIARQRTVGLLGAGLLAVSALLVGALVHFNRTGRNRERMLAGANTALETRNSELSAALSEVRTLEGLIPICANCKKVRDDRGFWEAVETYVADRSDANFSHSICGDCGPRLYPGDWPDTAAEPTGSDKASSTR
jgi:tetratricopeptide (TPR) repeat protein